jgi:hypothetical protein
MRNLITLEITPDRHAGVVYTIENEQQVRQKNDKSISIGSIFSIKQKLL